jgi:protease YdgD
LRTLRLAACLAALLAAMANAAEVSRSTLLSREAAKAWRAVGRVNVAGMRDRGLCTGALIAPDVVLTAAHCLVHPRTGEPWPIGNVAFVAGWYVGDMAGHRRAVAVALHPDHLAGDRSADGLGSDIALIRLAEPFAADAVTPFELAQPPLPGAALTLVSYRRDRPHAPTLQGGCPYQAVAGPLLILACPVTFGASGAPVFAQVEGQTRIVGILTAKGGGDEAPKAIAVRADLAVPMLMRSLAESSD